ncbi:ABC transporter permease [Cryptosporangium arvum]|uniref:Permease component of ribose/xylose/arabinose/galactoside ABC-type transporter n=1 Tax=Cryptosporangium arvum DSM 44712 TaxID=927661 RepID=A0A010YQT8_9ACTN|nr:ABC transporter permease [Cryptosporangium arvum]EXG82570.1 permease component of ribose/xylose/arabinose/galactoside ABC-type transporter [Cryptosporangium arvum DSM 44712]
MTEVVPTRTTLRPAFSLRSGVLTGIDSIMPVATVALMIFFAANKSSFLTTDNLLLVALQSAPLMVVAVGAALLLMCGYIDLSIGSVIAVSGVCAGLTFNAAGVTAGVLVGLGVGLAFGVVNGVLIGYLKLSPIIVTLGLLAAGRGLAQVLSPDALYGFPDPVLEFGNAKVFGVGTLVWIAGAVVVLGALLMTFLPVGRHIVAVGVNSRASYLSGIPVRRLVFGLYVLVGLLSALAGLLIVSRLDSAPSGTLGAGFEISVLTAVLLGGIPYSGGSGHLWRVVLGVWLMGILTNGITLMNVSSQLSQVLTGGVLVLAAALEGVRFWIHRSSR